MPSKILVLVVLFSVFMLPSSTVFGQASEPIIVDTTGQKKIRSVIVDGGGDKQQDEKFIDQQTNNLKGLLEDWSKKAKAGSDVTTIEDKTEEKIKEEIKKIGNSLVEGDELVVYYVGHGNVNTGAWFLYDSNFKPAGQISAEELKDTISGFEKITISIISYSCFGGKLEKVVEEAIDKNGDAYGNNVRAVGSDRLVSTDDFPKVFTPLGPTLDGKNPEGDKNGGFFTTDEYVEALKQLLKDLFKPDQIDETQGSACPLFEGAIVGGKLISIDYTALLLGTMQTGMIWWLPAVVIVGSAAAFFKLRSKNS